MQDAKHKLTSMIVSRRYFVSVTVGQPTNSQYASDADKKQELGIMPITRIVQNTPMIGFVRYIQLVACVARSQRLCPLLPSYPQVTVCTAS